MDSNSKTNVTSNIRSLLGRWGSSDGIRRQNRRLQDTVSVERYLQSAKEEQEKRFDEMVKNNPHFPMRQIRLVSRLSDPSRRANLMDIFYELNERRESQRMELEREEEQQQQVGIIDVGKNDPERHPSLSGELRHRLLDLRKWFQQMLETQEELAIAVQHYSQARNN